MLNVWRRHTLIQVSRFYKDIYRAAGEHCLNKWLVVGVVAQESAGNTYAVRCEPGFWKRYGKEMLRQALISPDKDDDKWMKFPELASTSYGLMQVMYQVALERGIRLKYPTELCNPTVGLDAGCRHLVYCLQRVEGDEYGGLLRYNGGGDPDYPRKVRRWADDARGSGSFTLVTHTGDDAGVGVAHLKPPNI